MSEDVKYRPKFGFDIRINPPREEAVRGNERRCEWAGCSLAGRHKAPRSRTALNQYVWFCQDHARAYNAQWNFFAGMDDDEIAAFQEAARTGHRPTWRMGVDGQAAAAGARVRGWYDAVDLGEDTTLLPDWMRARAKPRTPTRRLTRTQEDAFALFELQPTATAQEIKRRYKELVKRFHPDANRGEAGYEERLKRIIDAYQHLKAGGFC